MEKRPDALIEIALRALRQARKFLGGRTLAAYLADDQCQSAVERQLEIAGDANVLAHATRHSIIVAFMVSPQPAFPNCSQCLRRCSRRSRKKEEEAVMNREMPAVSRAEIRRAGYVSEENLSRPLVPRWT